MTTPLPVLVVGGGMITREVILPTLFQERRRGKVGDISVVSRRARTIAHLRDLFPDEPFTGYPDPETTDPEASHPELYRHVIAGLPADAAVIVATPDHLHTPVIMTSIETGHHLVVQKPLCLKTAEAHQIARAAHEAGIYVYTDYHKRHDPAIRAARYRFRRGDLGQMLYGSAWIEERREMPLIHFRRWAAESSPFEYIGVHYTDAYYFITGLKPRRVVAFGQRKLLPQHGMPDTYDAVQAVIEWEDGSVLWVQTSWVASDKQTALTRQGMHLVGTEGEYWADHKDRNVHFVTQKDGFEHYNPLFFKTYDSWEAEGETEVFGYGYDSIVQGLDDIRRIQAETAGLPEEEARRRRQELIARLEPLRPLPSQALIGTAINEAVRLSLDNGSCYVTFGPELTPAL